MAEVGLRPPKLTAELGWAARDPAGGAVVVVTPDGGVVVTVGAMSSALVRATSLFQASAVISMGSPKVAPPSVEMAVNTRVGSALGDVFPGRPRCQVT